MRYSTLEYETRLRAWQDTAKAANDLAHKVDFDKLAKLYKESADVKYAWTNFAESFTRRSNIEFSTRAIKLQTNMEVKGPEKNKKKQMSLCFQKYQGSVRLKMLCPKGFRWWSFRC